ncbi:UIMC1 [Acrasis kona]|uniref:UIMC1 n=1 Tax=Acrasis kona TaxID=1008807 RepID=A0AAW2ZJ50_9EUKA
MILKNKTMKYLIIIVLILLATNVGCENLDQCQQLRNTFETFPDLKEKEPECFNTIDMESNARNCYKEPTVFHAIAFNKNTKCRCPLCRKPPTVNIPEFM